MGQDGTCGWKSGSIQQHADRIISSSGGSAATFRLFDHITVSHTSSMAFSAITLLRRTATTTSRTTLNLHRVLV